MPDASFITTPRVGPPACPPVAWLPAGVTKTVENPLESRTVEWLDFAGVVPEEPFFTQTLARVRAHQARVETALSDLASLPSSSASPAGCIFHIGRCGSTLISNGLMLAERAVVVSEPELVSSLLMLSSETTWNKTMDDEARRQRSLLSGAASRYLDVWRGRDLIFKFTSWNLLHLEMLMSLWPATPFVVAIRNPCDVAASLAIKPTTWAMGHAVPGAAGGGGAGDFASDYAAVMLGTYFQAALPHARESRCRIVDYDMITPDMVGRIAAFFGLRFTGSAFARVTASFSVYSKDPARQRPFTRESETTRAEAKNGANTARAAAMARWGAQAAYVELREIAARQWAY